MEIEIKCNTSGYKNFSVSIVSTGSCFESGSSVRKGGIGSWKASPSANKGGVISTVSMGESSWEESISGQIITSDTHVYVSAAIRGSSQTAGRKQAVQSNSGQYWEITRCIKNACNIIFGMHGNTTGFEGGECGHAKATPTSR